jgi:NADH:ubiquinone oxidoreductase subunit 5 (subunit L)/multisubunit Na+/H+ antiporter MnhA subunit
MIVFLLPTLPLLGAGLILASSLARRQVGLASIATLGATLLVGAFAAVTEPSVGWAWSPTIQLGLEVSGFGRVMVVLVPLIALPILGYAASTEREGRTRLMVLLLAFVGAMLWLVTAADFITLLIGWELVGATSWALIGHRWTDPESVGSAARAFLTTRLGDIGLFVAAGVAFAATGRFAFSALGDASTEAVSVIAAGVVLAAAAKSAQIPFSPWLFAAMAGPTPVSALLHSATLVAAGVYVLIRLGAEFAAVPWFGPVVAGIGLATAISGGVVALLQTDAKRALAGSTSAQYGLMFIAVGTGSAAAAGSHLVAHAAFKSLLFLGAGVAIHAAGSGWLGGMRLGRALPRLAALSGVGVLALVGLPPLGAAWTKEHVLSAAVEASVLLGAGVLAASLLTVLYGARYQLLVYGQSSVANALRRTDYRPTRGEIGWPAALALLTVALSVAWLPGADRWVEAATGGALVAPKAWELPATLALLVAGFAVVWLLRRHLLAMGLPERLRAPAADWLWLPAATEAVIVRPVLMLSRALARLDDRVIDAGIRAVGWVALRVSAVFSRRGEWTFDGLVHAIAAMTLGSASATRRADDYGIDGAVEAGARGVGLAGASSRRLQTGQSHHYYVMIAVGLGVMLIVLLWSP